MSGFGVLGLGVLGLGVRKPPSWICEPCRETDHEKCVGRGHCDCQHRASAPSEPATGPAGE